MDKIDRLKFLQKLETLSAGLSSRELIEQSSCFVFTDGMLWTFNDAIACSRKSPLDIPDCAVGAKPLLELLRRLPDESITISAADKHLMIKGKNKRGGIRMEKEVMLPIGSIDSPNKWIKLSEHFLEALEFVVGCVSTKEDSFDLQCVHITKKFIEACDNFQFSRYPLKMKLENSILVLGKMIKSIIPLGMTEYSIAKGWIHFRNEAGLGYALRIYPADDYLDFSKLTITEGKPLSLGKTLAEAAERTAMFAEQLLDDTHNIHVELSKNQIVLKSESIDGFFQERKKAEYKGDKINFQIMPEQLALLARNYRQTLISDNRLTVQTDNNAIFVSVIEKKDD